MPVLPGSPPVEITLRRSARSRRFSLRISRLDGKVTVSLPLRARESEAMDFVRTQEPWLRQTLAGMPQRGQVGIGALLPVEGRMLLVQPGVGRGLQVADDSLRVPGDPARVGARLQAWLKVMARERLSEASDHYAGILGRQVTRITLRDTRSRWGSCSANGALMYSWRLIMAPPSVLRYVAAHEVAHLVEMNHSEAFWSVVEQIFPDWRRERRWLRRHGGALHGYGFAAGAELGD